jgi:hypothetical protein
MMKRSMLLAGLILVCLGGHCLAATIPAGARLIVRTTDAVSSNDRVGRIFTARLDQDVVVKGNVVLRAGTKVFGRIETSGAKHRRSVPLSLNLTSMVVGEKKVSIKTARGFHPAENGVVTRETRRGIGLGPYNVPTGTKMEFRLAQPVNF